MVNELTDDEIVNTVRTLASKYKCSAAYCLSFIEREIKWQRIAITNTPTGPWPEEVERYPIENNLLNLPPWTEMLVPDGSQFELHRYKDGAR